MSAIINKISVVCPIYNFELFVNQLCKTLLSQNFNIYEVIFVNDGSTDKTLEKLITYKADFINKKINIKIITTSHLGAGNARNVGIDLCSGDWIAFLDADDVWKENKLYEVNKTINQNKQINTILHYETLYIESKKIKLLKHGYNYNKNKSLIKQLFINNFFSTSALVFKKKLFLNNKFDINLPNAQDYELWLKISNNICLHIIKESLGNYNLNKNSITNRLYSKRIKSLLIIYLRYKKFVGLRIFTYKIIRTILSKEWLLDIKKVIFKI